MTTHLIGYVNRPTIDATPRVIRSMRFDRSQVAIVLPPSPEATIGTHVGMAERFRIDVGTGAITCRSDVEVADDMVLCPDLGVTAAPVPALILWEDAPLEVIEVHGILLALSLMPRATSWSW